MKKILFVTIHAGIGGIEKAFLNLMKELAIMNKYEIDIFMFSHIGELMREFPDNCKFFSEDKTLHLIGITQDMAWKEGLFTGVRRIFLGGFTKYISRKKGYEFAMRNVNSLPKYDIAISFHQGRSRSLYGGTNEFVLNKVHAERYYSFIHADLINAKIDTDYNKKLYAHFDKVVSVSESCRKLFVSRWPELEEKSYTVENCCNVDEIRKLAEEEKVVLENERVNFVTVARLAKEKGIIRTLEVFKEIKEKHTNFVWHLIGHGPERESIENCIAKFDLIDNVIVHGVKKNPYPYMKASDAFLLVSYREAAPVVIQEAHALGIPVLTTKTLSAEEMVKDAHIGIVCENSKNGIFHMIENILYNPIILSNIRDKMPDKIKDKAVKQFISLVGD